MTPMRRPERGEVADYYFTYIDKVPDGDIRQFVAAQAGEALAFLDSIPDEKTRHRYAPGKWTIRDVIGHVNDTERVFAYRAFWFARGFDTALPSFDQDVAVDAAGAGRRPWQSHLEEFRAVRAATVALLDSLPDEAWARGGIASGYPFTVRGLAYIAAGHVAHHVGVLRDRYL